MGAMAWLAVGAALFLAYVWGAYPLGMALRARLFGRQTATGPWRGRAVALMSARGEGKRLAAKARELAAGAAESGLAEVRIGLDGAYNADAEALRQELAGADGCPVTVVAFPEGGGKAAVLGGLMRKGGADAWVMMDVRQRVEPGAVRMLLERLADPTVAVASGELRFRTPGNASAKGSDSYWSYEKRLREAESRVWAVPGATGALYAVRAEDAEPPPPGTVLDDVWIPMRAVMKGKRCLFVRGAVAWDEAERDPAREAARKRRTNAGVWQLAAMEPGLLLPWRNPIWGMFWSHKMLRLLTPFACLAFLAGVVGGIAQAPMHVSDVLRGLEILALLGCVGFVSACALCAAAGPRLKSRVAGVLASMWNLNLVLLGAAWDAARGKWRGIWRG
jgi:hypothetical protein